ncbi:MAG: hypothetical protein ACE5GF_09275 [Thermodesulfobacteriota bacterium]
MRRGVVILSLVFMLFSGSSEVNAQAGRVISVGVIGVATLSENEAETKSDALEDAFRKAVAKVVESLVSREVLESDEGFIEWKIYSKAGEYIVNYAITSEPKIAQSAIGEPVYTLPIEAKVAVAPLKEELITTGVLKESGKLYKVILTIRDVSSYKDFKSLKARLEGMELVKGASYVSFYRNRFVLLADVTGSAGLLRERLLEEFTGEYEVGMVGENTLLLKKIKRSMEE